MTKAKHTPGPWRLNFSEIRPWALEPRLEDIVDAAGLKLYCPGIGITTDRDGEGLANARLIAAAPDMLEALKLCAEYLGELPPGGTREPLYVAYSAASDAITKATGAA